MKIVISVLIVFGLAEISKRANPHLAGMISGIPLGTGLSIYFISLEQGIDFTIRGIPWGIAGLAAALVFCFVYLVISGSLALNWKGTVIFLSSTGGIFAFLLSGYFIYSLEVNVASASFIFFCGIHVKSDPDEETGPPAGEGFGNQKHGNAVFHQRYNGWSDFNPDHRNGLYGRQQMGQYFKFISLYPFSAHCRTALRRRSSAFSIRHLWIFV